MDNLGDNDDDDDNDDFDNTTATDDDYDDDGGCSGFCWLLIKLMKCKCMSRCPWSSFNCIIF